jgi:O-6-methylguanine DNA methyltransferase
MQISQAAICSTTLGYPALSVNPVLRVHRTPFSVISCMRPGASCCGAGPGELHPMETLYSTILASPVGPLFLATSGKGLVALEFDARLPGQQTIRPNPRDLRSESGAVRFEISDRRLSPYQRELEEYFAGNRRQFSFPLDLRGTKFQLECWQALLEIPYGETRTYADIARAVGRPQGFRAVGMANNRNPIAIVVPCHRVIASDGTLCGYGGGLDIKRKLLQLEGALSGTLAA